MVTENITKPEVLKAAPSATPTSAEAKADAFTQNTMRDHFAAQKKVSVKCQKDEWVQVNGYTFIIKGGERVEVPEQIAQILDEAGRI